MKKVVCVLVLIASMGAAASAQTTIFRPAVQEPSPLVNTVFADFAPTVTGDGLKLYWTSNRVGTGGRDVWSVTRPDLVSPWANLQEVTSLNSTLNEDYMDVMDNDLQMFIASNRTGGQGLNDIWHFSRTAPNVAWGNAVSLPTNSALGEDDPSITEDGLELYYVDTSNTAAIYVATRPTPTSTVWTPGVAVPQAVSTFSDHSAAVSPDGLTLSWSSTRSGTSDIYIITRPDRNSSWSSPQLLSTNINTPAWDHNQQFGKDGFSLWYTQAATNVVWEARRILPLTVVEDQNGKTAPVQSGITAVKLGSSMFLSAVHDPGATALLLVALGKLPGPIALPGVQGALEVNLGTLIFPTAAANGVVSNTTGRYTLFGGSGVGIPNVGPLAGFTFYVQSGAQWTNPTPDVGISTLTTIQLIP